MPDTATVYHGVHQFFSYIVYNFSMVQDFKSRYMKLKFWKWVFIYIVIGTMVYVLVYYFGFAKNSADNNSETLNISPNHKKVVVIPKNWKTYSNHKYNFSLQYPSGLDYDSSEPTADLMKSEVIDIGVGHTVFNFLISKHPKAEVVDSFIAMSVQKREKNNSAFPKSAMIPNLISQQETSVDGQKAVKNTYTETRYDNGVATTTFTNAEYVFEKNGYVYKITAVGPDTAYLTMLDQVVSTFKFLK